MSEQQISASGNAPVPSPAVIDTMTRVIMSQTDMTEEQVKAALEHTNYDLKRVIREYMRGPDSSRLTAGATAATATSTNQMRFAEIRNFMDKSAEDYYRRREITKIYNQVHERKKAEAAEAAEAAAESDSAASKL
jgi:hypothetical protein